MATEQDILSMELTSNPIFFFNRAGVPLSDKILRKYANQEAELDTELTSINALKNELSEQAGVIEELSAIASEVLNRHPVSPQGYLDNTHSDIIYDRHHITLRESPQNLKIVKFMDSIWMKEHCLPPTKVVAKKFNIKNSEVQKFFYKLEALGIIKRNSYNNFIWARVSLHLMLK